jgi:hypothetical protein
MTTDNDALRDRIEALEAELEHLKHFDWLKSKRKAEQERDAYAVVVAGVLAIHEPSERDDGLGGYLCEGCDSRWENCPTRRILSSVPADILAARDRRVAAEALRGAVDYFESNVGIQELADGSTTRDGGHWTKESVEYAWDTQGVIMDWLRNRADAIEKGDRDVG